MRTKDVDDSVAEGGKRRAVAFVGERGHQVSIAHCFYVRSHPKLGVVQHRQNFLLRRIDFDFRPRRAHGRNAEEIVAYVTQGGQSPMNAVVAATSRAAESLGLGDRIGAIAPGMDADVIALDGDPLVDPEAFGRVVFVMRAGKVYRSESGTR